MPITLQWADADKTAIVVGLEGKWTWEDYYRHEPDMLAMIEGVPHRVSYLFDMRHSTGTPPDTLSQLRSMVKRPDPQNFTGHNIFIGASPFIKALSETFMKVYSKAEPLEDYREYYVESVPEALALIQRLEAAR